MREIKFRAWDKEKEMMFPVFSFDVNHVIPYGKDWVQKIPIPPDREYCALMQYTGLKDKNGKEIYEGDVVKFIDRNYEIQFRIGIFWGCNELYTEHYVCEVIGNIYDNPELLEVTNANK